jgi:hypothetical protein
MIVGRTVSTLFATIIAHFQHDAAEVLMAGKPLQSIGLAGRAAQAVFLVNFSHDSPALLLERRAA